MAKRLKGRKERKVLREVEGIIKRKEERVIARKKIRVKRTLKKVFKTKRDKPVKRAIGAKRLLKAISTGPVQRAGAGRPHGTYKYGIPIHEYRKRLTKRKALLQSFREEQEGRLGRRGLTSEQITQLKVAKVTKQPQQLSPEDVPKSVADEELAFRTWMAKKTISPNTQRILHRLRRTQLKSQRDDVEMQRRLKERRIVDNAGDIMKTPFIFKQHQLDITGIPESNILMAPNAFKEKIDNPNILKTNKLNILQTSEANNTLTFY